jgi:hypothetical protein
MCYVCPSVDLSAVVIARGNFYELGTPFDLCKYTLRTEARDDSTRFPDYANASHIKNFAQSIASGGDSGQPSGSRVAAP